MFTRGLNSDLPGSTTWLARFVETGHEAIPRSQTFHFPKWFHPNMESECKNGIMERMEPRLPTSLPHACALKNEVNPKVSP